MTLFDGYPNRPGYKATAPLTSAEAAARVCIRAQTLRAAVLRSLRECGPAREHQRTPRRGVGS